MNDIFKHLGSIKTYSFFLFKENVYMFNKNLSFVQLILEFLDEKSNTSFQKFHIKIVSLTNFLD